MSVPVAKTSLADLEQNVGLLTPGEHLGAHAFSSVECTLADLPAGDPGSTPAALSISRSSAR
jgi:hypothetical protein